MPVGIEQWRAGIASVKCCFVQKAHLAVYFIEYIFSIGFAISLLVDCDLVLYFSETK